MIEASEGGSTAPETEAVLFRFLPRLERLSHSFYERSMCGYRGIIIGAARPVRSLDVVRRLLPKAATGSLASASTNARYYTDIRFLMTVRINCHTAIWQAWGISPNHWVCKTGAVLSSKSRARAFAGDTLALTRNSAG